MSEQRKKILEMLASGKINTEEADRLLGALENNQSDEFDNELNLKGPKNIKEPLDMKEPMGIKEPKDIKKPKFLHVKVEKENSMGSRHKDVDIKIPILLLKAGMKLGSIIPEGSKSELNSHLNGKGIHVDLNSIDSKDIDAIMNSLAESSIDIDTENEKVSIYCK